MLPSHTLVVDDFNEFRELIQSWIDGHYELMVILGGAGLGKSETIERQMSIAKGKPNSKWAYIKGKISPLKLYQTLHDYRLLPIIFNDVDTLLKDETNVSLLKCVCDTSKVKKVQWSSTHSAFGSLPKNFDSISQVMLITNSWEKVSQNITALHNRGIVVLFRPTALEVHREVAEGGWFDDQEVWDFVGKNLYLMTQPDFRFYLHARNHKRAGKDWKDLTLRMMESALDFEAGQTGKEKEKLIFVAKLLADRKYDQMQAAESEREKVFKTCFGLGGSRATYHRHKRKLIERRGAFDLDAVDRIQWQGPTFSLTDFDVKQAQRRAALELERGELLKAGGLLSDDEAEEE